MPSANSCTAAATNRRPAPPSGDAIAPAAAEPIAANSTSANGYVGLIAATPSRRPVASTLRETILTACSARGGADREHGGTRERTECERRQSAPPAFARWPSSSANNATARGSMPAVPTNDTVVASVEAPGVESSGDRIAEGAAARRATGSTPKTSAASTALAPTRATAVPAEVTPATSATRVRRQGAARWSPRRGARRSRRCRCVRGQEE